MLLAFFSWWYGPGWKQVASSLSGRLRSLRDDFSVKQLLQTLFEPWRRIVTNPGRSLEDRWHAFLDNTVSRAVGFSVRICVLIAAAVTMAVVALLTLVEVIVWPLLPLAIPLLIVAGLI